MPWFSSFLVSFAVAVGVVFASEAFRPYDEKTRALLGRVGSASPAGISNVRLYIVTDADRAKIGASLASLPDLHREILLDHLERLSFMDGMPSKDSALDASR